MFTALENKIEILFPPKGFVWDDFTSRKLLPAFAPEVLSFLDDLSKALLNDPRLVAFPDLTAMGFWLRGAHIKKMAAEYEGRLLIARGTVFHLAPGNVDTIFVYSLVLGLLAGNRNIVRLGKRETPQQQVLLDILSGALQNHPVIADRLLLVRYGHDDEITGFFSANCNVRVIWGGDASVNAIRKLPLPPGSSELAFSGRFSLAVLQGGDFTEREIAGFVTDCFSFGQQGCSSPKLIVWLNTADDEKETFWSALESEWIKRRFTLSPAEAMSRWNDANDAAMQAAGPVQLKRPVGKKAFLRVQIKSWSDLKRELNHGNGLFYELDSASLEDVLKHCEESDQTVVTMGINSEMWREAVLDAPPKGIARIVPAGKALEFSHIWDGHDLIAEMSRRIAL